MKSVWGIDLGHSAVKAVRMSRSGSALVVQAYDIIPLTGGSTEMPREEILRGAIGALASRQRLRGDGIFLGIPIKGVLTKFINLPPVEEKKIPEIVNYEARQQIPFDLSEVIWRYQQVKKQFAPGEPVEIGLVAARKDSVGEMIDVLGDRRKKIMGVQVAPLALYNFVKYDQKLSGATVIIDIGAEVTDLVIASERGFWPRGLHIAGNSVNRALEEKFKVSFEEAESIKQGINESKFRKQIMDLLQPIFRELIGEVQRSLGYYKSLSKDVRLEDILLLGNGLKVSGLERFLAENLQYNVRKITDLQRIQLGRGIDPGEFAKALPGLGVALGLGVQALGMGEVTISLLPEEFVAAREISRKKPVAVAALLCVLVGLGLLHMRAIKTRDLIERVLAKDESAKVIEQATKLEKDWKEEQAKVNYERFDFLTRIPTRIGFPEKGEGAEAITANTAGLPRDFWLNAITHIRDIIPDHVYIRSLSVQIGDPEELRKMDQQKAGRPEVDIGAPEEEAGLGEVGRRAGDPTRNRLVITVTVETESHRGLEYVRDSFISPLTKLKWKPYKTPVFRNVEEVKPGIRHETRDGTGGVISGRPGEDVRSGAPSKKKAEETEEKVRDDILRRERTTYLVVPVRCVAKTEEDFKAETAVSEAPAE